MLKKGFGKAAVGHNVKTELGAGKPKAQAVAIAMDTARRAAKKAGKSLKGLKKPFA